MEGLWLSRGHGGSVFFDFNDGTDSIQGYIKKDEVKNGQHQLFLDTVDIGDFLEFKGVLFKTKKREKTFKLKEWKMLAKSISPLPSQWHGLQDIEERFRKRYLDLLMSDEVKEKFVLRSKVISAFRGFLDKDDFLEVETPVLQPLAGGATAQPFITHHNALDIDLYLRIAPELYLKQLLIGGFSKVYELGRIFRNEGIDVTHNPEFTMLEFYEAYSDAAKQRVFVEKMFKSVIKSVTKKTTIEYDGNKISFAKKFAVVSYLNLFKQYALIPQPEKMSRDDYALKAKQFGVDVKNHESKEKDNG